MQLTRNNTTSWSKFGEASLKDTRAIARNFFLHSDGVPERVLAHMRLLRGDDGGFPIDRLEHCLQTATRALEAGESEDFAICALVHDIGDTLASLNHASIGAAIMKPYVSEELFWMMANHDVFQGYHFWHKIGLNRNERDKYKEHPFYSTTLRFVDHYDEPSFDKNFVSLSLDEFEPIIQRVMANPCGTNAADLKKSFLEDSN